MREESMCSIVLNTYTDYMGRPKFTHIHLNILLKKHIAQHSPSYIYRSHLAACYITLFTAESLAK